MAQINHRKRTNNCTKPYETKHRMPFSGAVIIVAFFICSFVLLSEISYGLFNAVRNIFVAICPKFLNAPAVTKGNFYLATCVITITVSAYLSARIKKRIFPDIIIRDKKYILALFKGRGSKSPQPTRAKLIDFIYGKGPINQKTRNTISTLINEGITPISQYIDHSSADNNILCINSKWGSGKTTALLIAINESAKASNRYIYESAFKYSGNIGEFINDILKTINDVMIESCIKKSENLSSLIENFDGDPKVNVLNYILNLSNNSNDLLSSDIILKINHHYEHSTSETIIFVIIDDLDRLQGEDVVRVLSLLSIIRNLSFVRLIVPADLEVVGKSLHAYGVVDAHRFIEKYLPIGPSIELKSGYKYAEKIILDMLVRAQKGWKKNPDGAYPAFAAILIGMLAKKMRELTINRDNFRYKWLCSDPHQKTAKLTSPSEELTQLLRSPIALSSYANRTKSIYGWDEKFANSKKYQHIISALTKKTASDKASINIQDAFTNDDYANVVEPWVFDFVEANWELLGFAIRDVLDELSSVNYSQLPKNPAKQFVYVFNQLFPDEKLKYVNAI
ncbi:MAG: KAP family NTPase [Candidatus Saccharibacteria bacterium]|nr:KAP family NTPase [Candidatus Saccharibacteria bacterium]